MGNKDNKKRKLSSLARKKHYENMRTENRKGKYRKMREEGERSDSGAPLPPVEPGVEHTADDRDLALLVHEDGSDESEGELCIQIKEEVGEAIPVEFLASTSELPLQAPQFNISVAPTSVDCQEPAYSISINEIADPLSQETTSTIHNNLNISIPLGNDSLLQPRGVITVPDDLLRTGQYDYVRPRGRPKKIETATKLNNGTKKKKISKETGGDDDNKVVVMKRNPPRQAKTMTYAQELMDRKLKDIMQSQKKILTTLKEMPNVAVSEEGTKPSGKEDRFDICGRHIASLLRELPTFDALALEAKLMEIVYKEREKLETFRKSLQCYSAVMLPHQ